MLASQPLQDFSTHASAPIAGGILAVAGVVAVVFIPAVAGFPIVVETSKHIVLSPNF
jgi:hypothetical protein